jgi:hypothetical protein
MTTARNTERNDIELPPDDVGVRTALGRCIPTAIRDIGNCSRLACRSAPIGKMWLTIIPMLSLLPSVKSHVIGFL